MAYRARTLAEHFDRTAPKRVLALDGGGLRGIVTLSYLKKIEALLAERHDAGEEFRLAHYFDLIAGTSTGSIIAAALATGMTVDEIAATYLELGREVFTRSMWRKGLFRARYDQAKLTPHLQELVGEETTLGSAKLLTGLLVVTKRIDTGSIWPLGNNPRGRYHRAGEGDERIANADYPLWRVVRASTAAPTFFDPEEITIAEAPGLDPVVGTFVDGGVSPFNTPTLQAVMYAVLAGYDVRWATGAENLLVVSVGTGRGHAGVKPSWLAATGAVQSLLSMMDDSAALMETMVQWMSTGPTHREIDGEIGSLEDDLLCGLPLFTYARYDLSFERVDIDALKPGLDDTTLESLSEMDEPANMPLLQELAARDAELKIAEHHFPKAFDLA